MHTMGLTVVATLLLDLALIVIATRTVGALFRRLGQPVVVGEILAGIALGPSLLGGIVVAGAPLSHWLFPPAAVDQLTGIANLGLVLFMMIVGLELSLGPVRTLGRQAATISLSSVVLPMVLGGLLGLWLYESAGVTGSRIAFVLFIGVAMSVTAFPVLARILVERQLHRTRLGVLVLACAGVDDVLAWSLLALATALAQGENAAGAARVIGLLALFCVVLHVLVRPCLRRLTAWYRRVGRLTPVMLAVVVTGLCLSAATTELIGVHFVFGAFLFGAAVPREDSAELVRELLARLEQVAVLVLLPVFFVVTGMTVDLRFHDSRQVAVLGVVLVVACVGKFVGAASAARLTGVNRRQSLAVGVLLNTRGLTELVVVSVGYQVGLLSRELVTVLVVMAVVTTVLTRPLLQLVYPDRLIAQDVADAGRTSDRAGEVFRCLVLVDDPATARDRIQLARDLLPEHGQTDLLLLWRTPLDVAGGGCPVASRRNSTGSAATSSRRMPSPRSSTTAGRAVRCCTTSATGAGSCCFVGLTPSNPIA